MGVEYDGSAFNGWQSQPDMPNIQDTLQSALSTIANEKVSIIAAGRTDTGVHALGQVVHFDTSADRILHSWVRGSNALLPKSVAVLWARPVPEEFHARFSAHARSYRYLLVNRPVRSAVQHGKVGWFHARLDLENMREAAHHLVGLQDFSAFRSSQCQAKTPIKVLSQLDIEKQGDMFVFNLTANAFLHHMVRNIIGCLVFVGKGKYPPSWIRDVLESRDRALAAPTFSPCGLYLRRIGYDEKWGLPVNE